ncbi:MAG: hypothetical protein QGD90_03475, partial [Candidatus Hydrogenedentes bacterium]|nr:hypothetical protein [Candidatus Hydrogenedentota bacterium]
SKSVVRKDVGVRVSLGAPITSMRYAKGRWYEPDLADESALYSVSSLIALTRSNCVQAPRRLYARFAADCGIRRNQENSDLNDSIQT